MIHESGLCVWQSGHQPRLDFKTSGSFLAGRMAVLWTGSSHTTYSLTDLKRDFSLIEVGLLLAQPSITEHKVLGM